MSTLVLPSPSNIQVGFITSTFYRPVDKLRISLAIESARQAQTRNYPFFVVDGSPAESTVADRLRALGAQVFPETKSGMGSSRRESFSHALDFCMTAGMVSDISQYSLDQVWRYWAWIEPEKTGMIELVPYILEQARLIGKEIGCLPGLILFRKTKESEESFPWFQRPLEETANRVFRFASRTEESQANMMFGPVMFHESFLSAYAYYDPTRFPVPDNYFHHSATLALIAEKEQASVVEVPFIYLPAQKAEEEGAFSQAMLEKRFRQQRELIDTYLIVGEQLGLIRRKHLVDTAAETFTLAAASAIH